MNKIRLCFFGSYERKNYNILFKKILESENCQIIECHHDVTGVFSLITAYVTLFFKHRSLEYDLMIIPWRGIMTLPLAKTISRKPIISLAYLSIYDTLVNDRKRVKKGSVFAKLLHFIIYVEIRIVLL